VKNRFQNLPFKFNLQRYTVYRSGVAQMTRGYVYAVDRWH
jgi:hypothetical protein